MALHKPRNALILVAGTLVFAGVMVGGEDGGIVDNATALFASGADSPSHETDPPLSASPPVETGSESVSESAFDAAPDGWIDEIEVFEPEPFAPEPYDPDPYEPELFDTGPAEPELFTGGPARQAERRSAAGSDAPDGLRRDLQDALE